MTHDVEPYPIDPLRALPAAAYREAAFAAEVDAVFRHDWVFVGTADEVAEPGDYVTTDLGGQPVIVLRRQDGELAAMSNLCSHRGTQLVDGFGNTKRFQCPYHAWTFADDGRLLGVPHATRDDVDRDAHCLPTYRAELWHGLLFVCLDPNVPALAERLAHLEPAATEGDFAELHHWTNRRGEEVWDANWKLVISNAMESYHLFHVHPETLEPYAPTAGAYYVVGNADGTVTGVFDSGYNRPIGRIILTKFDNAGKLAQLGDNLLVETLSSGKKVTGEPGTAGFGEIRSQMLEQSNVDLSLEFVKMIESQRGFQANAKTVTTSDEMITELINMKR